MNYEGLPQTVIIKETAKEVFYLKNVFENTYLVDIKERHCLKNEAELDALVVIIASSIGSLSPYYITKIVSKK